MYSINRQTKGMIKHTNRDLSRGPSKKFSKQSSKVRRTGVPSGPLPTVKYITYITSLHTSIHDKTALIRTFRRLNKAPFTAPRLAELHVAVIVHDQYPPGRRYNRIRQLDNRLCTTYRLDLALKYRANQYLRTITRSLGQRQLLSSLHAGTFTVPGTAIGLLVTLPLLAILLKRNVNTRSLTFLISKIGNLTYLKFTLYYCAFKLV